MEALPEALQQFAARLPVPLYAVGGCVRDALRGTPSHDIDLASALSPEAIRAYATEAGVSCPIVNERLGTVLLCIGDRQYEHTTFRTESYPQGGAHAPSAVAFTDSLEADAFRRDFSINAIYRNVLTDALTDPTGGIPDIERRILRTTTENPAEILRDDGLRILRLVRFAVTTGFAVEPRTMQSAIENVALLRDVAWERRRQELDRLLVLDDVLRALKLLESLGAWPYLIPELDEGAGIAQRPDFHRYDVREHLYHTCAAMPPEVPLRLMGLLHDVGKPRCLRETGDFHRHAVYGEAMAAEILRRLTYPNAIVRRVTRAVRAHMFDLDGQAKVVTVRKRFVSLGRQGTEDCIALREGDVRGSGFDTDYVAARWRGVYADMLKDGCPWSIADLRITGREVCETLGVPPSRVVSETLQKLLLHCVAHPKDNRPERLKRLAQGDYRPKA